jgi:hypothetical protein
VSGCRSDGDRPSAARPWGGAAPAGNRTRCSSLVRGRQTSSPGALWKNGRLVRDVGWYSRNQSGDGSRLAEGPSGPFARQRCAESGRPYAGSTTAARQVESAQRSVSADPFPLPSSSADLADRLHGAVQPWDVRFNEATVERNPAMWRGGWWASRIPKYPTPLSAEELGLPPEGM